jgi:hypothetical protein
MFLSAMNEGPGLNTAGSPANATKALSIGGYVHKDTWLSNVLVSVNKADSLAFFSSRGPQEDGGLKPDVVSPGAFTLSTIPMWEPPFDFPYPLPRGTPRSKAHRSPRRLRQAAPPSWSARPSRTARSSSRTSSGRRGAPLAGSWPGTARTSRATGSSSAPVNTVLSDFLMTPDRGVGIYEREGWVAGQSSQRTITFTRTTGGSKPIRYNLSWVGDGGTFDSAGSVSLPLNTPVGLLVGVHPAASGAHSAILRLDDPATAGVDYAVLNTVVAAGQPTAVRHRAGMA